MNKKEALLFSSDIRGKYLAAKDLISDYGWEYFLKEIFPWLLKRRYYFYAESLREIVRVAPPQVPIQLSILTGEDFSELIALRPHTYNYSILRNRMRQGHFCFIGRTHSKIIHVRWMFRKSIYLPYLHRTLLLSPEEIYADDAYTVPEHRRKGVFAHAGYLLRLKLRELGYSRYLYAFASWQAMARKLGQGIDLNKIGELKISNWLASKKHYWQGVVREHGDGKIRLI